MNIGFSPTIFDRLFNVLAQFPSALSESALNYCHQEVIYEVFREFLREESKTYDLRKLGNFKKIPKMCGTESNYPAVYPKENF